jgi:hypothetical protein
VGCRDDLDEAQHDAKRQHLQLDGHEQSLFVFGGLYLTDRNAIHRDQGVNEAFTSVAW